MRPLAFAAMLAALATASAAQPKPPVLDDPAYARPQRLVDIGGRRMNLYCLGRGSPTVVLDSGLSDPMLVWAAVQPAIARETRVCAYDRAGIGFSDPSGRPGDSADIARDLHRLLRLAGIRPPYVLVGHSYGGLNVRLFAYLHPSEVAGLVLIDPAQEDGDAPYAGVDPSAAAGHARRLAKNRACAEEVPAAGFAPGSAAFERCVVPAEAWFSPRLNAMRRRLEASRAFQRAQLSEVESITSGASAREVAGARRPLGDLPLIVLSAQPDPAAAPSATAGDRVHWRLHQAIAETSSRGIHQGVTNSGHYIQLDRPEVVIDAVSRVLRERPVGCCS